MKATAIIVAAGEGRRIGGESGKMHLPLGGRKLLFRTLDQFYCSRRVDPPVVLVVARDEIGQWETLLAEDRQLQKRRWVLQSGGATRQESVRRGLEKIPADCEVVAVHDGARPFVSPALIDRTIEEAWRLGAVVAGVPVRDTIKIITPERLVAATPPRASLWEIHTPQAFHRALIIEAHDWALRNRFQATDDAMLIERLGKPVHVIDGERSNIKITVPDDLLLAEALLRQSSAP